MKFTKKILPALFGLAGFALSTPAHAWGRHDLITRIVLDSPALQRLSSVPVTPEPIEKAAPDLMKRVVPGLELWAEQYHRVHDTRYSWKTPEAKPELSAREQLLWALEDNMKTPLDSGNEHTAGEILTRYVMEPDGMMDEGLEASPYIERLKPSMSYFASNDEHTHAFRHYYVPSSLLPPILSPKGIAPYRADLYAHLAEGAFATGHPYWGYRFLAWSLHYLQDVTQPWHTVFLPGLSFLSFSKSGMKHEISALHYLTEAFADTWVEEMAGPRSAERSLAVADFPQPTLTKVSLEVKSEDPWFVSELTEELAQKAHGKAAEIAGLARDFFRPIVDKLTPELKLKSRFFPMGGLQLASAKLDFGNDGKGATEFLQPMWNPRFSLGNARDKLMKEVAEQLDSAIEGSRLLLVHVLPVLDHGDPLAMLGRADHETPGLSPAAVE